MVSSNKGSASLTLAAAWDVDGTVLREGTVSWLSALLRVSPALVVRLLCEAWSALYTCHCWSLGAGPMSVTP
jgi:hypothetical protein